MSQIVIKKRSGETVRAIDVPAAGISVLELAQHLREQRGGLRPAPHDLVTIDAGEADKLPDTEFQPKQRSCGS